MKKYKDYELYDVYVNGEVVLNQIFGYEVKEEISFLKKMYSVESGRPRIIDVKKSKGR